MPARALPRSRCPGLPAPTRSAALPMVAALLVACAPAHDWRESRSADGVVQVLFPCKPQQHDRRVSLAGSEVKLSLMACEAGGQTWGLAVADLADPARHAQVLDELAQSTSRNVAATARSVPWQVGGATPHAGSRRLWLQGQRPDGQAVQMQQAVFVHGPRVYQATVLGDRVPDTVADTFFASLRVAP